jgi:SAM-dependent methyltransferase
MVPAEIRQLLDELPDSALVLDVGGWGEPDPRADWVMDIGSYQTRNAYSRLGQVIAPRVERFSAETWVQRDICSSEPWPFEDSMFDVVLCTHTLEDIRDPIRVCEELSRVGKAGYIETPPAAIELTRGAESPLWCGWKHHRWLVRAEGGEVVFLGKPHHIHSPFWPSVPSPKRLHPDAAQPFSFRWEGSFQAREEIIVEFDELDAKLRSIVRESSTEDLSASVRRSLREQAWLGYRRLRAAAGRARRPAGAA